MYLHAELGEAGVSVSVVVVLNCNQLELCLCIWANKHQHQITTHSRTDTGSQGSWKVEYRVNILYLSLFLTGSSYITINNKRWMVFFLNNIFKRYVLLCFEVNTLCGVLYITFSSYILGLVYENICDCVGTSIDHLMTAVTAWEYVFT